MAASDWRLIDGQWVKVSGPPPNVPPGTTLDTTSWFQNGMSNAFGGGPAQMRPGSPYLGFSNVNGGNMFTAPQAGGGGGSDWWKNPLLWGTALTAGASIYGAYNQNRTNEQNLQAQQAHNANIERYVQSLMMQGQNPYAQAFGQMVGNFGAYGSGAVGQMGGFGGGAPGFPPAVGSAPPAGPAYQPDGRQSGVPTVPTAGMRGPQGMPQAPAVSASMGSVDPTAYNFQAAPAQRGRGLVPNLADIAMQRVGDMQMRQYGGGLDQREAPGWETGGPNMQNALPAVGGPNIQVAGREVNGPAAQRGMFNFGHSIPHRPGTGGGQGLPGLAGTTGATGGIAGQLPIASLSQMPTAGEGFNIGQDGLMQMMRRDVGLVQDPSVTSGLAQAMGGQTGFNNTELFKSLGALDELALNRQVTQLQGSAGSFGQRFGTALNQNEADMRGNFTAQAQARNAQIAQQSHEAAQARAMQGLGMGMQREQFGTTAGLQNAGLQLGAAGQLSNLGLQQQQMGLQNNQFNAGNQNQMLQFGLGQRMGYDQLAMQALSQANQAQMSQNQYNAGLAGLLAGQPIPQSMPSPWAGAAGDIGMLMMLYPHLRNA